MKNNLYKKIVASVILCFFLVTILFPLVQSQINNPHIAPTLDSINWWNIQWPYRKLITIDHTKVSADLTNFPVLISEPTDPDVAAVAQPNGEDLIFIRYDDNATILSHEIEYFNQPTGNLVAWVNVETLSATTDTKFWVYYGNPSCGPQQDITGTWDINYVMVQHLNETGSSMLDSTGYNSNGISIGTTLVSPAKIDGGRQYDDNDRIVVNNFIHSPNALTVEAWVYRDNTSFSYIACKGIYSNTDTDWILYLRNNQSGNQGIDFSIKNHTSFIRKGDTPIGTWFHVTATYNSGSVALYYNGMQIGTSVGWPAIPNAYPHLGLGNDYNGTEGGFYPMTDVRLDEIRVSAIARSSSWIATSYVNQNNPATFTSFASEEAYTYSLTLTSDPPAGGTITAVPAPPYSYNTTVTLTAVPNSGYVFDYWSGNLTGTQNPSTILINGNKSVTASFVVTGNTPPVAIDDSATVTENSNNNQIDVLANDYDPDGDPLSILSVKQPGHGVSTQDGSFVYYTPNASYTGPDSFTYTISDGFGGTASATVFITVTPTGENTPPYPPSQPVPANGETNVSITTHLWWLGGDPDPGDSVTYDVYFGTTITPPLVSPNQTTNTYNPGTLGYETTYYWRIISTDAHNATTSGALWSFTTQGGQEESISVTITRPSEYSFYLHNIRLLSLPRLSLPRTTYIYGPITIKATVTTTNTSVDYVEFYIDGKLKKSDDTAPYTYRWAPLQSFKHTIMVKAYDIDQEVAIDELTVFKWRLHPIILLGAGLLLTSN